jgi:uncharacterized protein YcbX
VQEIGRVVELWRYPVKSMGGERIASARAEPGSGIAGDRGWAVRDEKAGEIRGAKHIPGLLRCSARYREEPRAGSATPVEIELAGGRRTHSGDPAIHASLSQELGREVTLWPLRPSSDLEHYRRAGSASADELRELLGLVPGEPLPVFSSATPPELAHFVARPGTYFDAFDLHLLTRASLAELAKAAPGAQIDVRRFRPNLLIDTRGATGQPELDWCGAELRVGSLRLRVLEPMLRCAMTVHAQPGLAREPRIMRALVRETGQRLGVAASVIEPGELSAGDRVWRLG